MPAFSGPAEWEESSTKEQHPQGFCPLRELPSIPAPTALALKSVNCILPYMAQVGISGTAAFMLELRASKFVPNPLGRVLVSHTLSSVSDVFPTGAQSQIL